MSRRRIVSAAVPLAGLALLLTTAEAVNATPGVLRVSASTPSLGHAITITTPGGGTFSADPGAHDVTLSMADGTRLTSAAWCVDRTRRIDEGIDYRVDVQTPDDTADLRTPRAQAAAWLIGEADGLVAAAADPGREAAAVQLAVWRLTGQAADVWGVTADAGLNGRAEALRSLADGRTPATSLAMSAAPLAPVIGTPAALTVTGTAGAVVDLAVGAGAGALASSRVVIGPAGSALVDLVPSGAGTVRVDATARGGRLIRAAHLAGASAPQDMAIVLTQPLAASAAVSAVATSPAVVPPSAPTVATQRPARLRLGKTAPTRVVWNRVIPYTLTVVNRSAVTADDVVVRDPVPAGVSLGTLPRIARLEGGAVVWRLGDLAPGARRIVHLRLRADVRPTGAVVNVARASASNAAAVLARARTTVIAPRRVAPAHIPVTG